MIWVKIAPSAGVMQANSAVRIASRVRRGVVTENGARTEASENAHLDASSARRVSICSRDTVVVDPCECAVADITVRTSSPRHPSASSSFQLRSRSPLQSVSLETPRTVVMCWAKRVSCMPYFR